MSNVSMKLIIGLGNPGPKYSATRHNIGFRIIDALREQQNLPAWEENPRLHAMLSSSMVGDTVVVLAKPTTFMNTSGKAAAALQQHYEPSIDDIVVVHDDADLALGTVTLERERGAAGHHGVESVIDAFGANAFWRLRCGIRTPERDASDLNVFALKPFHPDERGIVDTMISEAEAKLNQWITESH